MYRVYLIVPLDPIAGSHSSNAIYKSRARLLPHLAVTAMRFIRETGVNGARKFCCRRRKYPALTCVSALDRNRPWSRKETRGSIHVKKCISSDSVTLYTSRLPLREVKL